MKRIATLLAVAAASLAPAMAADFSEGSKAKSWNLYAEEKAKFEAEVVDILCTVTGDCANQCGVGRQLGLLRSADGVLVFPNKNTQTGFQGAAVDLHPHCGTMVEVDGLLINDEDLPGSTNIYQVQLITPAGAGEAVKANTWSKNWAKLHPEAKGKGPWFRRDPRVNARIAETGYLGLGIPHEEAYEITR